MKLLGGRGGDVTKLVMLWWLWWWWKRMEVEDYMKIGEGEEEVEDEKYFWDEEEEESALIVELGEQWALLMTGWMGRGRVRGKREGLTTGEAYEELGEGRKRGKRGGEEGKIEWKNANEERERERRGGNGRTLLLISFFSMSLLTENGLSFLPVDFSHPSVCRERHGTHWLVGKLINTGCRWFRHCPRGQWPTFRSPRALPLPPPFCSRGYKNVELIKTMPVEKVPCLSPLFVIVLLLSAVLAWRQCWPSNGVFWSLGPQNSSVWSLPWYLTVIERQEKSTVSKNLFYAKIWFIYLYLKPNQQDKKP